MKKKTCKSEKHSPFRGKVIDYYGGVLSDDVATSRKQILLIKEWFCEDAKVGDSFYIVITRRKKK